MRTAVCSFLFLAAASLAQAQGSSVNQGQAAKVPSCEQFTLIYHQKYFLNNVRAALQVAMLGGGMDFTDRGVQNLGDGTSVDVLKVVDPKDLTKPQFVKAYLQVVRTAFSQPEMTLCEEDKSPEVTLFLLDYLREKVEDKELQREIDSTKEFVLKQAGPPKRSPIEIPSQSAK
jgi:hypothetical protein